MKASDSIDGYTSYLDGVVDSVADTLDIGSVDVLVVEDEKLVAEMYHEWLSNAGHSVRVARSGRDALDEVDGDVDVVLLDRRMPYVTGDEALSVLRSDDIDEMQPERFRGDNPYHLDDPDDWSWDVPMEVTKKLDTETVEHLQNQDLDCRVCMVTAVDPDVDILDLDFDHYLVKDVERDRLVDIIERLAELGNLSDSARRYQAARWKRFLLEQSKADAELEDNTEYQELEQEIRELEAEGGEDIERIREIEFR